MAATKNNKAEVGAPKKAKKKATKKISKKVSKKSKKSAKALSSSSKKSSKKTSGKTKKNAKKKVLTNKNKKSAKKSLAKKSSAKKGVKNSVAKVIARKKETAKKKKGLAEERKVKSRHVTTYEVEVGTHVLQPDVDGDDDMLNQLIAPLEPEKFFEKHWHPKQAAAFLGGGATRSLPFKKIMDGLDLKSLLERSPSDGIMCWMKPQQKHIVKGREHCVPLESITVDEATALKLHECFGAAMYFRAPEEVSDAVLQPLCAALGMNFTSYFADGAPRSETETFVAKKGHVTGWHTDFQNNFTTQLKGRRRWRLRHEYAGEQQPGFKVKDFLKKVKGDQAKVSKNNVRGLAPHYATMETYETQMKAVNGTNHSADAKFLPPKEFFDSADEVILEPGDVLFHPAGVWHQVEALDDCVAINFSLLNLSYADLIGASCVHALTAAGSMFTERISIPPSQNHIVSYEAFAEQKNEIRDCNGLEPEEERTMRTLYDGYVHSVYKRHIAEKIDMAIQVLRQMLDETTVLPPCMMTPRKTFIRISETMPSLLLHYPDKLIKNPLATIVDLVDEVREEDSADEDCEEEYSQIAVHVNYFGQERLESLARTVISFPTRLKPFLNRVISKREAVEDIRFDSADGQMDGVFDCNYVAINEGNESFDVSTIGAGADYIIKEKLVSTLVFAGFFRDTPTRTEGVHAGPREQHEEYLYQINPDQAIQVLPDRTDLAHLNPPHLGLY
jgi:hypothetical protein